MPNLLTAAISSSAGEERELYQDYRRGYYEDGAYVAASSPSLARKTQATADDDIDPQEAYYTSLLQQFRTVSSALRSSSSRSPPSHFTLTTADTLNTAPLKKWRTTLLYTPPTTSLLSQLAQESIINGISALEKYLDWKMVGRGQFVGAWAWGLLARCREVGVMDSEEVGVLRALGKKARAMVRASSAGLDGEEGSREDEFGSGVEDGEGLQGVKGEGGRDKEGTVQDLSRETGLKEADGGEKNVQPEPNTLDNGPLNGSDAGLNDDDMAEAKQRLLATLQEVQPSNPSDSSPQIEDNAGSLSHPRSSPVRPELAAISSPSLQEGNAPNESAPNGIANEGQIPLSSRTAATLDMIITIVGEEYGQRDLLVGRMVWE